MSGKYKIQKVKALCRSTRKIGIVKDFSSLINFLFPDEEMLLMNNFRITIYESQGRRLMIKYVLMQNNSIKSSRILFLVRYSRNRLIG